MEKEFYHDKNERCIADIEDETELKQIYTYAHTKWCRSKSSLNKYFALESVEKQISAMSIAQYRRNIHECIYSIHEKDGLDRIFNLAMRIKQAQSEKK